MHKVRYRLLPLNPENTTGDIARFILLSQGDGKDSNGQTAREIHEREEELYPGSRHVRAAVAGPADRRQVLSSYKLGSGKL